MTSKTSSTSTLFRVLPFIFWVLALATIPVWGHFEQPAPGWDLRVYSNAIHSLQQGHDPYLDGMARQDAFHETPQAHDPTVMPPYTYVYSPITLPLLRIVGHTRQSIGGPVYSLLYFLGMLAAVWACMQAAEPSERRMIEMFAPAAIFFPGLIQNDVLFSGNVAYILYGVVFAAAVWGWRRDRWAFFYIATLAVSLCKAPLLTLLAIPVFSARRQWLPAGVTAVAGVALFAVQPLLWPSTTRHYLQAVNLQFVYNHDFGFSPAGVLGDILYSFHQPYTAATTILYLAYLVPLLATLFVLSRRFLRGDFSLRQWIPVLFVGVILLNPRIKEYDVAPLTLPMLLIAWRLFARGNRIRRTLLETALFFGFVNAFGAGNAARWRPLDCALLVGLFAAGSWNLLRPAVTTTQPAEQHDLAYASMS